tara:strand:- start:474 stop:683 length:210 start_codon:yes stop_codon:yes gene_type:complete
LYNGATRYKGVQFHFHHHSEHSIDGKYMDLEMHTVHLGVKDEKGKNPGNVKYAAMGIMFSVEDYNVDLP